MVGARPGCDETYQRTGNFYYMMLMVGYFHAVRGIHLLCSGSRANLRRRRRCHRAE